MCVRRLSHHTASNKRCPYQAPDVTASTVAFSLPAMKIPVRADSSPADLACSTIISPDRVPSPYSGTSCHCLCILSHLSLPRRPLPIECLRCELDALFAPAASLSLHHSRLTYIFFAQLAFQIG
jgi:hypothetical protein